MSKKKKLTIIAVSIVLILAMLCAYFVLKPKTNEGSKSITVTVEHLASKETTFNFKTDAKYLREVLEEKDLIKGTESTYGLWVQTVDGETADDSKQQWWGFTINGEFGQYGVDQQVVSDGDIYVFTLNQGY